MRGPSLKAKDKKLFTETSCTERPQKTPQPAAVYDTIGQLFLLRTAWDILLHPAPYTAHTSAFVCIVRMCECHSVMTSDHQSGDELPRELRHSHVFSTELELAYLSFHQMQYFFFLVFLGFFFVAS